MPAPKGIRNKSSLDWYSRYLSVGGAWRDNQNGNPPQTVVSLYNEGAQGAYLFVYGIDCSNEFAYWHFLYWAQGTVGTFQNQCARNNPFMAAPPGQIYLQNLTHNTHFPGTPWATFGNVVGSLPINPFPVAIVPPSWSLVVEPQMSTANVGITFWYLPMIDQQGTKVI